MVRRGPIMLARDYSIETTLHQSVREERRD